MGFAKFIGYKGQIYDESIETGQLAIKTIFDNDAREILSEKKIEAIEFIKIKQMDLNYSTKEFKNFLE